jgi:hypothetical protein
LVESLAADRPACFVVNPINQTRLVQALARVPEESVERFDDPFES